MHDDRATLDVVDGVAELRLNRPDAANGIDPAMVDALDDAVRAVESSSDARVLLITAAGRHFCVGGDLQHFHAHIDDIHGQLDQMISTWHRSTLRRLAHLPIPVVAAARGGAGGGGLGLLWGADVVIAGDDLRLVTGFTKLGMTGDGGSSWHLPRLVGMRRAQQLTLRSTPLTAAEALEWGLVSQVVPAADADDVARAEARALAAGPTWAYGKIKGLLADGLLRSYDDQLVAELDTMLDGAGRDDVREGILAFVERRDPKFDGR